MTNLWFSRNLLSLSLNQMTSSWSCRDSRALLGHFFLAENASNVPDNLFPRRDEVNLSRGRIQKSKVSCHFPEGYVASLSSPLNRYRCVSRDYRSASPRISAGLTFVKFIWAKDIGKRACVKTEWRDQRRGCIFARERDGSGKGGGEGQRD